MRVERAARLCLPTSSVCDGSAWTVQQQDAVQALVLSDDAQGLLANGMPQTNGGSEAESWCTHVDSQQLHADGSHAESSSGRRCCRASPGTR